jgi:hypothetical protein
MIDGSNHVLYNSWSSSEALSSNYKLPANWTAISGVLLDLDSGLEFNWKETPITGDMNVTIAVKAPENNTDPGL